MDRVPKAKENAEWSAHCPYQEKPIIFLRWPGLGGEKTRTFEWALLVRTIVIIMGVREEHDCRKQPAMEFVGLSQSEATRQELSLVRAVDESIERGGGDGAIIPSAQAFFCLSRLVSFFIWYLIFFAFVLLFVFFFLIRFYTLLFLRLEFTLPCLKLRLQLWITQ